MSAAASSDSPLSSLDPTAPPARTVPKGVRWARASAWLAVALVAVYVLRPVFAGAEAVGLPLAMKSFFLLAYAAVIALPWGRIRAPELWRPLFTLLCVLSFVFVFVLVISTLFAAQAAEAAGEKLGVPGFEGSLIFLCLLQVPAVLFERHPEWLE